MATVQAASVVTAAEKNKIHQKFAQLNLAVSEVQPAPIAGFKQVETSRGLYFISDDLQNVIAGEIYHFNAAGQPENIKSKYFVKKVESLKNEMIIYPAKAEKYTITVFTDITCGYCRKLHQEMQQYNDLGITVRYLAWPRRGGPTGATAEKMAEVWCAKDKNTALTKAESGQAFNAQPATAQCRAQIKKHYQLGQQMGVSGTPAIVFENGQMVPGYLPASKMLSQLKRAQK